MSYVLTASYNISVYREWPRKNAQSLLHRHIATVCSEIARISAKCTETNWQHEERANLNIVLNILCLAAGKETTLKLKSINHRRHFRNKAGAFSKVRVTPVAIVRVLCTTLATTQGYST